ncbi:MAG: hypothetical protein PWR25_1218 [Euryarchaeota archaeon]|nr:hypothetical protein [Euryarchaeota archaeon]
MRVEKRKINENQEMPPASVVEGGGRVVVYDTPEELDLLYDEVAADPGISGVVVFVARERFDRPVQD